MEEKEREMEEGRRDMERSQQDAEARATALAEELARERAGRGRPAGLTGGVETAGREALSCGSGWYFFELEGEELEGMEQEQVDG